MESIENTTARISTRVSKLFKNQQIYFFIIMFLILLITCYSLLSSTLRYTISLILSNPGVMVVCITIILAIGYFDIGIASLALVLFFILLFGNANSLENNTGIEGFRTANTTSEDEEDSTASADDSNRHIKKISKTLTRSQNNLKIKEEKEKKLNERVDSIKNVVLGTINNIRNSNNDDYKRALLENKQAILYEEHENNNTRSHSTNRNKEQFNDTVPHNRKGGKSKNSEERFQTVEVRALDPSNEDDTNLLITKEILQDMLNRIEYNYETNKYLRKYIKHRVEEIIDINKLMDDE